MRSSRTESRSPLLFLVGLLVVVAVGAGAFFVLQGDDEGDTGAPVAIAPVTETAAPPEFENTAPVEASRLQLPVDAGLPQHEAPIVASLGEPTGGISGLVVDKTRNPVPGVKLSVYRGNALLGGSGFPGSRRAVDAVTTSGPDGRFELKRVPVGQPYVVVGEHDEYARSEVSGMRVQKDAVTSDVVLLMTDGAVVMGSVLVKGGGPIPNARVELYYQLDMAFLKPEEHRPFKVVFTDNAGRFAFTHVSSSSIKVRVSADGFETQARTVSYALEPEPRDATLDFELSPGLSLPGRVMTDRGAPVARARIEVNSAGKDVQSTAVAMSDEAGNFLLDGMGTGNYQLRATCPGFSDKTMPRVDVSAGYINVEMQRRGAARGFVTSLTGQPVTAFSLHLYKHAEGRDPTSLNDERSFRAGDGSFLFDNLDPGDYVLESRADDWADTRSAPFTVLSGDDPATQVTIAMGKGGTLRGTIRTADGQPAAGALMQLNENGYQDSPLTQIFKSIAPDDTRERKLKAGADGSFAFERIPPGVYQVSGQHEDAAPIVMNDVWIVDDAQGGNKPLELVLPRGAIIAGRALTATQAPLAYCKVQISRKDDDLSFMDVGTTDAAGGFTFRNLREGSYQITVTPERDDQDKPLHPFLKLVHAQKSMQTVFVGEGQVLDGVLISLPASLN
jgi:uncharacterized GH25 family protein